MIIKMNDNPERQKKIEEVLPAQPLTETHLFPLFWEMTRTILLKMLLMEIEIYKAFPKENGKYDLELFEPRNNKTCFLGLGFFRNGQGGWQDKDLITYRKRVGTISHHVWGSNVTLLEIWGADHFEKYPDMVKGVYAYCYEQGPLPEIQFYVNPLYLSKETGIWQPNEEDKAEARLLILAQENELRRQHGLAPVDYTMEEIEEFEKAGEWDATYKCLKSEVPEKQREAERRKWQEEQDEYEDDED